MKWTLLLIASFLTIGGTAQPAMVRYRIDGKGLLMDPCGNQLSGINNPLPYITYRAPNPCVKENAPVADYFYWGEEKGWEYVYTVEREWSPDGSLQREFTYDRETHQAISLESFAYDEHDRLVFRSKDTPGIDGILQETERHYVEYETESGIILNDSLQTYRNGKWETEKVLKTTVSRDQDQHIISTKQAVYSRPYRYEPSISRFTYEAGKLSSIEQANYNHLTGKELPVFRYDGFKYAAGEQDRLTDYKSYSSKDGNWEPFRSDHLDESRSTEETFTGNILIPNEQYSIHKNQVFKDLNGNLIRSVQVAYDAKRNAMDTLADVRFEIDYTVGQKTPATVVSTYRSSSGEHLNSIKVLYREKTELDVFANQLLVFPNPANGKVCVQWNVNTEPGAYLELFDGFGKKLLEQKITMTDSGKIALDVSKLPPGNYSIAVSGTNLSAPLIVAH